MPRFVLLQHTRSGDTHWDFMLEAGASLRTWALAQLPNATGTIPARALAEHRLDYLDYEGPVSGGRGDVRRIDRGDYTVEHESEDRLVVRLDGCRLRGVATLVRLDDDAPEQWHFTWRDETSGDGVPCSRLP